MPRKKKEKALERIEEHVEEIKEEHLDELKKDVAETGKDLDELKEDVQEIMEEVSDSGKDVEEIKEDVEEIKEDVEEIAKSHRSIMERLSSKLHLPTPTKFNISDIAQQVVGALILSTPFTVTEEVWNLAQHLDIIRIVLIISLTILFDVLLIYFSKFQQIDLSNILSVFARLFSIIMISYIAAGLLLYTFGVIGNQITDPAWAVRLIILVGLPANIGAATADILK